ncbi:MAG: hypothetical protein KC996_02580 [Phycisphaerales bacterium]|nr:hypothetical protein [Phycisphaerales bacterium]
MIRIHPALRSLGRILPPTTVLGLVESIEAAHIAHRAIHLLSDASLLVTRTRITRCIFREQHGHTAARVCGRTGHDAPAAQPAARYSASG